MTKSNSSKNLIKNLKMIIKSNHGRYDSCRKRSDSLKMQSRALKTPKRKSSEDFTKILITKISRSNN